MSYVPVRVGDSLRDSEDPGFIKPSEKSLCENCFHQVTCSAAQEAERIGALIAACPHSFPVLDEGQEPPEPSPT